jgi:hypothetical protein
MAPLFFYVNTWGIVLWWGVLVPSFPCEQRLEANRKTRADAFYQKKKEAAKLLAAATKVVDGTA